MYFSSAHGQIICDLNDLIRSDCAKGALNSFPNRPSDLIGPSGDAFDEYFSKEYPDGNALTKADMDSVFEVAGIQIRLFATIDIIIPDEQSFSLAFYVPYSLFNKKPCEAFEAKLKLSALIYAQNAEIEQVKCGIIMMLQDGRARRLDYLYSRDELEAFASAMLARRQDDFLSVKTRADGIAQSLPSLKFPYGNIRPGQHDLINSVYNTISKGGRLFVQAPTGIGKTISTLYGALRAYSKGTFRRIFYLTAKASTAREAFRAAALLYHSGADIRTVVLSAKEHCCPRTREGIFVCDSDKCPFTQKYYDKKDEAIKELISQYHGITRSTIEAVSAKYGLCPYELSLDVSELCDIIICDYNYVFSPAIRLQRYFSSNERDSVVLVDEAHNLPERARDMFSAEISTELLSKLKPYILSSGKLKKSYDALLLSLDGQAELCDDIITDAEGIKHGFYINSSPLSELNEKVNLFFEEFESFFRSHKNDSEIMAASSELYRQVRAWCDCSENYSDKYRIFIELSGDKVIAKQYCLDPSGRLSDILSSLHSAVFFSATLTPTAYFSELLGGGKKARSLNLPSPFPSENLFIAAVTGVGTRFEQRDRSVKKIVSVIARTAAARAGNYIVFFPSYKYMEAALSVFRDKFPKVSILVQKRNMSRSEKDEFIASFKNDKGKLRIGFCVLGGSFSEGIDLSGDRLIGTIIVGVGLPGLSNERNIIREYYSDKSDDATGFDFAYTYPGMNSVLQAAGRVIRSDDDRGVVILIDDRYETPQYRALMPPHWEKLSFFESSEELSAPLAEFWQKKQ